MGNTMAGAASGENGFYGAEGFTISGKRTEEEIVLSYAHSSSVLSKIGANPIFFYL